MYQGIALIIAERNVRHYPRPKDYPTEAPIVKNLRS